MSRQAVMAICSVIFGVMTYSSVALSQQKTAAECRNEWRANKAANQASGITEKAFVAQCRGGASPSQTTAAPTAPPVSGPALAPAGAGGKTATECRNEWRANKAANQASGITEKAFVAQCRGGASPSQTTAAPAAPPASGPVLAPVGASGKTVAECRNEWRANKAANQASGITERAFVAQCRSGAGSAQTTAAPTAPPPGTPTATAAPTAPAPAPSTAARPVRPSREPEPGNPVASNEFSTEAQAKVHCPTDTVVWANLPTRVYHFSGTRYYGETEHGAFMCEADTVAAGMRPAKNEKHP
jgi:hypothetical protein